MAADREARIRSVMAACGCSYDEALKTIREDEKIDRGERMDWEPTEEEEKAIRAANKVKAERKPRAKGEKRERPADQVKREIIDKIRALLEDNYDNVIVENIEKAIEFSVNGENYAIDLKQHREKKKA